MFNSFNPDLKITAASGKFFSLSETDSSKIYAIDGVDCYTGVIEENALIAYKDKQYIATIKGVSDEFNKSSLIDSMITEGDYFLKKGSANFAVIGQGISYFLGISLNDFENPLIIYAPRHFKGTRPDLLEAFNNLTIMPSSIFSVQQEYDEKYVIVPVRFARELFELPHQLSALEIKLKKNADSQKVQRQLQQLLGNQYVIKNRYQQEELMYRIMKSEKLAVFIILGFILLIAIFNVIGSLSMLILEKRKDIAIFKSLGAGNMMIRNIFFIEGMMITWLGAILGLLLGGIICWFQKTFGFLKIASSASLVVEAYPVRMMFSDFIYVLLLITLIGFIAAWYPVKYISKKYLAFRFE